MSLIVITVKSSVTSEERSSLFRKRGVVTVRDVAASLSALRDQNAELLSVEVQDD